LVITAGTNLQSYWGYLSTDKKQCSLYKFFKDTYKSCFQPLPFNFNYPKRKGVVALLVRRESVCRDFNKKLRAPVLAAADAVGEWEERPTHSMYI
jgi:hypothetical protein